MENISLCSNVKCGMMSQSDNVELGMWNVECGMWNDGDFAVQNPII